MELPGLNLIAAPGRRRAALDLAREIERRGFAEIQVSSQFSNMAQCLGMAFATEHIPFATSIAPIYAQTVDEFAQDAAYIHEISGGRFRFGIGIAHGPTHVRMGVTPGKPLGDIRTFVARYKAHDRVGAAAAGHPRHPAQAHDRARPAEIADGIVFADGSRSHMAESLADAGGQARDPEFYIGNRIRTCISDDIAEAKAMLRRTMIGIMR